jgi:uncharacterized protein (DUF2345 family)
MKLLAKFNLVLLLVRNRRQARGRPHDRQYQQDIQQNHTHQKDRHQVSTGNLDAPELAVTGRAGFSLACGGLKPAPSNAMPISEAG